MKNDKYRGLYIYNKNGAKRKKNRVLIEEFGEIVNKTAITPIVSEELFDKVQTILVNRKNVSVPQQKADKPYLLTGLIYCKKCGKSISGATQINGRSKIRYRLYVCPNHQSKNGKICTTKAINADYLERAVKTIIKNSVNAYLKNNALNNDVFVKLKKELNEEVLIVSRNKQNLEKKINGLMERITKSNSEVLIESYENAIVKDTESKKILEQQILKIKSKITALENLLTNVEGRELLAEEDIFCNTEESREIIRLFVSKIEIDDANDEIDIKFNV